MAKMTSKKKRNPKDATDSVEAVRRHALGTRLTKRIYHLNERLVVVDRQLRELRETVEFQFKRIDALERRVTLLDDPTG